jgi:hypothetical protein
MVTRQAGPVTPLSLGAHRAASSAAIGPAVLIVVVLVVTARFAFFRNGKGTPAGRALAVVLALAIGWVLLAVTQPRAASTVVSGTASGLALLLRSAAHLVGKG